MGIRTSARCGGLNHVAGNDRRQTLAILLGGGLAGAALGASRQAWAGATQMAPLPADEHFMRMEIAEAARADFPFGTVIVRDGEVLSTGRNLGKPPTIRRRTAKWLRSAASSRCGPPPSSRAQPSTPRANLVPCA